MKVSHKDVSPLSVYQERGYKNRRDYLESLSLEYGASLFTVHQLAELLGRNEDFDGLLVALEDGDW